MIEKNLEKAGPGESELFSFRCFKVAKQGEKHFVGKLYLGRLDLYKVDVSEDFVIKIIQESHQKAKYSLPVQLETHLKWGVKEEIKNEKKYFRLSSFKFHEVGIMGGVQYYKKVKLEND
jgi:calcium-dependent protein kinase